MNFSRILPACSSSMILGHLRFVADLEAPGIVEFSGPGHVSWRQPSWVELQIYPQIRSVIPGKLYKFYSLLISPLLLKIRIGGSVVKNLLCNAGDMGYIPGQGTKILHATGQLSLCTNRQSMCHNKSLNSHDKMKVQCAAHKVTSTAKLINEH